MKWNNVEENLPKSAGHYLVVAEWMGVIEKGEFDGKSKWSINHLFEPTHWMTLPDGPTLEAMYGSNESMRQFRTVIETVEDEK